LEKVAFFIRLIGNPWILSWMPAGFQHFAAGWRR
jgi:hypothetical protein